MINLRVWINEGEKIVNIVDSVEVISNDYELMDFIEKDLKNYDCDVNDVMNIFGDYVGFGIVEECDDIEGIEVVDMRWCELMNEEVLGFYDMIVD